MKRVAISLLACAASVAAAAEFPDIGRVGQPVLAAITRDVGAAIAYRGVTPASSLGIAGFDVGLEVTDTRIEDRAAWRAAGSDAPADVVLPKLHIHKGLFGGLDIAAFVAGAPQVEVRVIGAALKYALLDDGIATPAVALRVSGSRAFETGDLRVSTAALDALVSKRFTALTPYAGAGVVRLQGSVAGAELSEERVNKGRVFAGLNFNMLTANVAVEAEKLGEVLSLSAKVGFRF